MPTPRFGAWLEDDGAHFSIWAPSAAHVNLLIEDRAPVPMARDSRGVYAATLGAEPPGTRYRYGVDGKPPVPDPASGWQPDGVHGPSALDDARAFEWRNAPVDINPRDLAIYELHIGTFTPEGTFDSARAKLSYLRELGVTAIELMPVAEFPGARNWGYDGAALFAPSSVYGGPDALRRLVDDAHAHGLAVILDVVYNHLGPDGAYLHAVSPEFFARDAENPWGAAVDLSNPVVCDWLIANAIHWAGSYRIDGFRLDATHALPHAGTPAFLRALVARTRAATGRPLVFIAEDHRHIPDMLRSPAEGGWGLDGVWADDFHHHVRVMAAGDSHGYYAQYSGDAKDLARTIRHGWDPGAGDAAAIDHEAFVFCIQNHDQIGNRAFGDRLHDAVGVAALRAASALLLLAPATPLIFMGQEWAASSPFQYFTDHGGELGRLVTEGRRREFSAFPDFRERVTEIPDPQAASTFEASRLRWDELERRPHAGVLNLYRALLSVRRSERLLHPRTFALDSTTTGIQYDGFALIARLKGDGLVSLGGRFVDGWETVLTTEDAAFADDGAAPRVEQDAITFTGPAGVLLRRV